MKYRKRVFAMDERELRAAIGLLMAERSAELANADRGSLQEELVQWLLSEGLSARHEFLLYREKAEGEEGEEQVWLLSRRTRGCACCCGGDGQGASPSLSPCPTPARRSPSPSPRPRGPSPSSYSKAAPLSAIPRRNQPTAVILRPTHLPVEGGGGGKNNAVTVVKVQPMPGRGGEKVPSTAEEKKKKSFGEECCVECGHFCVDLISTLK